MNHVMLMCGSLSVDAAFVAGLAGSVHCLTMCGGLSAALGTRTRHRSMSVGRSASHSVTYQFGRLASYTLAGAAVGAAGGALDTLFDVDLMAVVMRTLAGLVMMAAATSILFKWRPLALIERLGGRLWARWVPLARSAPATGFGGSLLIGMLWGWMPCGLVYSMLLLAAFAGGAARGAATMLAFGLGTVPAVLVGGLLSGHAFRVAMGRRLHVVAGSLLLAFGVLTIAAPLSMRAMR